MPRAAVRSEPMPCPQPLRVRVGLLAGGQGQRLGGQDKGLIEIGGQRQVERLLRQVLAQDLWSDQVRCVGLHISANRHAEQYRHCLRALQAEQLRHLSGSLKVIADRQAGFLGPLMGMSTLLESDWEQTMPAQAWRGQAGHGPQDHDQVPMVYWFLPVDVLQMPRGALRSLWQAMKSPKDSPAVWARWGGRDMYPCCLVSAQAVAGAEPARQLQAMAQQQRGVREWLTGLGAQAVELFDAVPCPQPVNLNHPDEVDAAQRCVSVR